MNFAGVGGTSANPINKYKYNGKELQSDHNLNWYDYGWRFYDPMIARFHTIDPLTEKNNSQSGFVYAANNPILYIDYMGLDSAQRAQAVDAAIAIVDANPNQDPKLYHPDGNKKTGAKGKNPGEAMDCSGMAANTREAGGEENPVGTPEAIEAAKELTGKAEPNGVAQLAATAEISTDTKSIEVGNEIYFGDYTHVGTITNINTNKDGNVTSVDFQHSIGSTGPKTSNAKTNGKGYWGSRIKSYGKWDKKPDKK